jgi:hypothetical protein
VEERSEREDINPSHRGTAEPIWLAGFYEISPSPLSKGKKRKENLPQKGKQQASSRWLVETEEKEKDNNNK